MKSIISIVAVLVAVGTYFLIQHDSGGQPIPSVSTSQSVPPSLWPTVSTTITPKAKASPLSKLILQSVPFTSQAPSGNWDDQRQQDGCEETSAIMAMAWVRGTGLTAAGAEKEILAISDFEQATYGSYHDTSAEDTVKRIFNAYFHYNKAVAVNNPSADDIIAELEKGNLVLTPMDGRKLNNPYYTPPGPDRHMLVVIGYDPATKEFITNDPGTRRGKSYRYGASLFMAAILNYPTGDHNPVIGSPKAMIVVSK